MSENKNRMVVLEKFIFHQRGSWSWERPGEGTLRILNDFHLFERSHGRETMIAVEGLKDRDNVYAQGYILPMDEEEGKPCKFFLLASIGVPNYYCFFFLLCLYVCLNPRDFNIVVGCR